MSNQESENNKRIAKNTIALYIRTLITMAVGLYTSRVVLNVLGVEDYGVYNVVGGVVSMFAHHDDVFGGNGRFIHELEEALIIMIRINTWGGIDRSSNNIGYQRAQANHAVTVFGMHGIDEQDDGSIVVRVYDDGSTGVSGVPVGIRTKIISVIGSVGGEIIPS